MSAMLGRLGGRATQSAFRSTATQAAFRSRIRAASSEATSTASTATEDVKKSALNKGAKRDPELYILLAIMTGAFCLVGWHFTAKPTASTSEAPTSMAMGTMPWQTDAVGDFKYQYHPGGDKSKPLKNAPSALISNYWPPMTLPKKAHDKFNRYGKDDWD